MHLQFLGFPVMNDPLYNHIVFGPEKGKGGNIGKSEEKLIADLISIHNAENWLGLDEDGLGPVQPGSIIGQNIQLREPEGMHAMDIILARKVMSNRLKLSITIFSRNNR